MEISGIIPSLNGGYIRKLSIHKGESLQMMKTENASSVVPGVPYAHKSHFLKRCVEDEEFKLQAQINRRKKLLQRGQTLYKVGAASKSFYIVQSGTIKVSCINEDGDEQILGFHLPREVFGLDTVLGQARTNSATAIDTAMICQIPLPRLDEIIWEQTELLSLIHRLVIDELSRNQSFQVLLCNGNAEEKIRWFLKDFSRRLSMLGLSSTRFRLPVTRKDIANFLGLSVETVSRVFTNLQKEGYLFISGRELVLRKKLLISLSEIQPAQARKRELVDSESSCTA